jgi:hypothetical protein
MRRESCPQGEVAAWKASAEAPPEQRVSVSIAGMKNLRLALDFNTDEDNVPKARIYVAGTFPTSGDPFVYLSTDCTSASQLGEAIEHLKRELDNIQNEANAKFKSK